jgi:hypothetical protein
LPIAAGLAYLFSTGRVLRLEEEIQGPFTAFRMTNEIGRNDQRR